MPQYRLVRYRGRWAVSYVDRAGQRRRFSLGTSDEAEAESALAAFIAERSRPDGTTVAALWAAYVKENEGKAVIVTMAHTWKALAPRFANVRPEDISVDLCRQHASIRRAAGIRDGTIWTELGHLRMVLVWGAKRRAIREAPHVERPPKPRPKERHLTREEAKALHAAATMPHVKLFITLALTTAARTGALLALTWERVDFERGMIQLRDPNDPTPRKGRATVPMNRQCRAALLDARRGAQTDRVIEWGGRPVLSIKKGIATAAKKAGLAEVTPHVLRHSAAVWMAEAGTAMPEIAQYLGHGDSRITERVYSRFSPEYLRHASAALEFDDLSPAHGSSEPKRRASE